ncbi:alpha-1,2-fucosyltransferase [Flavitalea sp.]|nr:alpha-1,2-fucosyltransferase [Flavitalea sp.]
MIIISDQPGQLANLLFVYANFVAYGIENKVFIYNPAFYKHKEDFILKKSSLPVTKLIYEFCGRITKRLFILGINNKIIGVKKIQPEEFTDLENIQIFKPSLFYFVSGWPYRTNRLVLKHQDRIRSFFRPKPVYQKQVNEFFKAKFQDQDELIIGVHIRRGDYKEFLNGLYYYEFTEYEKVMDQMVRLFSGRSIRFLICSNDTLNHSTFQNKNLKITFGPNHQILDLYCLSKCDFILGPPSTYSMWASFYGQVPLYKLTDMNKQVTSSDFQVQRDL